MTGNFQGTKTEIPRIEDTTAQGSTMEEMFVERLEVLTNQTGQLSRDVQDRPVKYSIQIRDIGDNSYQLSEPLLITIEEYQSEETVIASFPELEVFGEGFTESEAITNLKFAILDLFDELNDSPENELGELPKNWLNVLRKVIVKTK